MPFAIRNAEANDECHVVEMWRTCGLVVEHAAPGADFRFALDGPNSSVLVGVDGEDRIRASAMVGHDGHRGWLYYVGVEPASRGVGHGRRMIDANEAWLRERGVAKVHRLVRETNAGVIAFYERLGFTVAPRTVMAKRLPAPSP